MSQQQQADQSKCPPSSGIADPDQQEQTEYEAAEYQSFDKNARQASAGQQIMKHAKSFYQFIVPVAQLNLSASSQQKNPPQPKYTDPRIRHQNIFGVNVGERMNKSQAHGAAPARFAAGLRDQYGNTRKRDLSNAEKPVSRFEESRVSENQGGFLPPQEPETSQYQFGQMESITNFEPVRVEQMDQVSMSSRGQFSYHKIGTGSTQLSMSKSHRNFQNVARMVNPQQLSQIGSQANLSMVLNSTRDAPQHRFDQIQREKNVALAAVLQSRQQMVPRQPMVAVAGKKFAPFIDEYKLKVTIHSVQIDIPLSIKMTIQATYSPPGQVKCPQDLAQQTVTTQKKCRVNEVSTKRQAPRGKSASTTKSQQPLQITQKSEFKFADFKNQEVELSLFTLSSKQDFIEAQSEYFRSLREQGEEPRQPADLTYDDQKCNFKLMAVSEDQQKLIGVLNWPIALVNGIAKAEANIERKVVKFTRAIEKNSSICLTTRLIPVKVHSPHDYLQKYFEPARSPAANAADVTEPQENLDDSQIVQMEEQRGQASSRMSERDLGAAPVDDQYPDEQTVVLRKKPEILTQINAAQGIPIKMRSPMYQAMTTSSKPKTEAKPGYKSPFIKKVEMGIDQLPSKLQSQQPSLLNSGAKPSEYSTREKPADKSANMSRNSDDVVEWVHDQNQQAEEAEQLRQPKPAEQLQQAAPVLDKSMDVSEVTKAGRVPAPFDDYSEEKKVVELNDTTKDPEEEQINIQRPESTIRTITEMPPPEVAEVNPTSYGQPNNKPMESANLQNARSEYFQESTAPVQPHFDPRLKRPQPNEEGSIRSTVGRLFEGVVSTVSSAIQQQQEYYSNRRSHSSRQPQNRYMRGVANQPVPTNPSSSQMGYGPPEATRIKSAQKLLQSQRFGAERAERPPPVARTFRGSFVAQTPLSGRPSIQASFLQSPQPSASRVQTFEPASAAAENSIAELETLRKENKFLKESLDNQQNQFGSKMQIMQEKQELYEKKYKKRKEETMELKQQLESQFQECLQIQLNAESEFKNEYEYMVHLCQKQEELKNLFETKFIQAVKEKEQLVIRMEHDLAQEKEHNEEERDKLARMFEDEKEAFQQKITIHQNDIKALIEQKADLESQLQQKASEASNNLEVISKLNSTIEQQDERIAKLDEDLQGTKAEVEQQSKLKVEGEAGLSMELEEKDKRLTAAESKVKELELLLEAARAEAKEKSDENLKLEKTILKQSSELDNKAQEMQEQRAEIKRQTEMLVEAKEENEEVNERLRFTEQQLIQVKQYWAEAECAREQFLSEQE